MDFDNLGRLMSGMGALIAVVSLGITVLVVAGVAFLLWRIFGGMGRANAERERLLREGVRASARILNVEMGGMTMTVGVHRHLQLKLTVEVQPPDRPNYQAVVTTMISELQIPQVQPGVVATVRFDPNDASKVVLEGVGVGAAAAGSGAGVPVSIGATPRMSTGAKIGLAIGALGALVGIGAAVVVTIIALGVGGFGAAGGFSAPASRPSSGGGSSTSPASSGADDVCSRAIRCCETISGGSAGSCGNLGKFGVPASACQTALTSYQRAARSMGKKCS